MRKKVDNIEIVEPPVQELTKHNSGFKKACFTGCGCVVLFIIALFIGIRIYVGPGPKNLTSVPPNFPAEIPIYDKDAIDKITFVPGKYKNRGLETAAIFPKIILSPLFLALNKEGSNALTPTSTMLEREANVVRNLWKLITAPVGDHRDTVQIEWRNVNAEPNFFISYFKKELEKKNYAIEIESRGQGVRQFSFSGLNGVTGMLYVKNNEKNYSGTDYAILTVNFSATSTKK